MSLWLIIVIVVVVGIGITIFTRSKGQKIKVTLANNEIHHYVRPWYFFWLYDGSKMIAFRNEAGKIIKIATHWIISVEDE